MCSGSKSIIDLTKSGLRIAFLTLSQDKSFLSLSSPTIIKTAYIANIINSGGFAICYISNSFFLSIPFIAFFAYSTAGYASDNSYIIGPFFSPIYCYFKEIVYIKLLTVSYFVYASYFFVTISANLLSAIFLASSNY